MIDIFPYIMIAMLIEAVITGFSSLIEPLAQKQMPDLKYLTSLVLGILVCVVYSIDLFDFFGFVAQVPFVGMVLTGVIVARGSNYVADLINTLNAAKSSALDKIA